MRAIVHDQYGPPDVLHLEEDGSPTPKAREVLIEVRATRFQVGEVAAEPS